MDDIRAMIQDELRQAVTGLMSPPLAAAIPITPTIPSTANISPTATVPTAFAVPHVVFILPTTILTNDSRGKLSNSVKVVPTMQMKKKNVKKARKKSYQTGGTRQGTTSRAIEVHALQLLKKFSNFNQPLSKVLEHLMQKGLLQPLPNPNLPNPNTSDYNPNKHCKFHQNLKHSTDSCMRLKHEIQNLIDSGKIIDPENPNTKN